MLLRRTLAAGLRLTCAAASAPPPALARGLLLAARRVRLLLLRRTLLLLRALRSRTALLLRLLRAPAAALLLLPRTLAVALAPVARLLLWLRLLAVVALDLLPRALLEVAHLLVHVARGLPLLLETRFVMPAIRAALPSLGIGLLAGVAEDAFRERHREIGAHCTLRPVDPARRRTLLTLIDLAGENSPNACWDDRRAMQLLRAQATAEELRELGMDEQLIAQVFAEEHAG